MRHIQTNLYADTDGHTYRQAEERKKHFLVKLFETDENGTTC